MNELKSLSVAESVAELESRIRDFINHPRKITRLVQDEAKWNAICSALDAIGDAEEGLHAYKNMRDTSHWGELYVLIYGVLQLLYVEQDAVKSLSKAFDFPFTPNDEVREIREIRNRSVGHPASDKNGGFHFISRTSMSKNGFNFISRWLGKPGFEHRHVNIFDLIEKQQRALGKILTDTLNKLKEGELAHRKMFKQQKLANFFHPSTPWLISKLYEAISSDQLFPLGKPHVEILAKQIDAFEEALAKRGLGNTATYEITDLRYAFDELKKFFASDPLTKLTNKDAEFFTLVVEQKIMHLRSIAIEIDREYDSDV